MAMSLKAKLADPSRLLNFQVCVIPSAVATQAMAAAGTDCLIFDQEHGPVDFASLHAMIASTQGTACAPLVRIAEIHEVHVKRALDAGAEGVCFPLARTAKDVERCVSAMRYPPSGKRGWGPFVAHSRWGTQMFEYAAGPAAETVCMVLLETVDAVKNIDEICAVEGVDIFVIAPFDLSTELGISGQFEHPKMKETVGQLESAVLRAGIPLGGVALTRDATQSLISRGYRMTGGLDVLWLKSAVAQSCDWSKP